MKEFSFEYKQISSKCLVVDEGYQRLLDFSRVKRIVSNFNPNLINPIKVSYRDGKYFIFDGQHTLKSLMTRNGGDLMVDCKVYYGMTYEDEARMFSEQNGLCRNVESNQKLLALYEAKDVDVVDFKNAVEECGISCTFRKTGNSRNHIVCYKSAFDIYTKYGKSHFQEVLRTILEIWGGEVESLRKEIIVGMDIFMRIYKGEYSKSALVKRLSLVSPITLCRDGKAFVTGGNKRYARIILQYYNKNTSSNRLEDRI